MFSLLILDQLLVVCPVYNEEGRIGKVLDGIQKLTDNVIVINDGSTDNSLLEIEIHQVKVISHQFNWGKGRAIRTGMDYFLSSGFDYVLFMDGDGQHKPEDIPAFISQLEKEEADLVIGSRFDDNKWKTTMPFPRKFSNLMSRFGLWLLYNGFTVKDPQNGFRVYRKRLVKCLSFYPHKYETEMEILILSYLMNFRVVNIPIESLYSENQSSKFSLLYDTWTIPNVMLKLFFFYRPWLLRSNNKKLGFRARKQEESMLNFSVNNLPKYIVPS